ncbi:avrblb2 family secreted RxLR effector peptide protein, putative [Phytophthora infestans T30-4]|uniref:Avrblb2 family secreted RxLR effector peptide protein, putative n=3 Tax=Phytophthora infestans TaxID=4787 RepID=D0N0J0_PHYIT|nr:avrblb2 family secreted RxLR effector peptide protein, putative [Phytophthora infestans T30-4]EEY67153.1 avrblb2 family secreted RxLR effector peptide protein, putative [Phytophthora infestans T30-4]|eukprot:XP_002905801.1 avrblb2 family secreted RxLR effector peptide protein, putative [Phytophthora infestans T30-4]
MRSFLYGVLAFAVLARSSAVAAFPIPDESRPLSKTSPDTVAPRSLRIEAQEVIQSGRGDGYGGFWKNVAQSTNKIVKRPDIKISKLIAAAKKAKAKMTKS